MNDLGLPRASAADREALRSAALHSYGVLDTEPEVAFDDLARIASDVCGTPIAVVNLVDTHRQFFKAEVGLGVRETPLETSFCGHAILLDDFMMVPDARQDPRFRGNPLVEAEGGLRFYAGALLKTPDGLPIGTMCVLDTVPRELDAHQIQTLKLLARQAMTQLELRRALARHRADELRNRRILDSAVDHGIVALDLDGTVADWNRGAETILGWSRAAAIGQPADRVFRTDEAEAPALAAEMATASRDGCAVHEGWQLRRDGTRFYASSELVPLRDEAEDHVGYVRIVRDGTRERRRVHRLALLGRASAALLSADDPAEALLPILETGADTIGFEESYTYEITPDCAHLSLTHSIGVDAAARAALAHVSFDIPVCGLVAASAEPLVLSHILANEDPRYALARQAGIDAYAGFPIRSRGRMVGVISFASRTAPVFDGESIEFFASVARFLSIARERVDNERSLRQSEERQRLALAAGEIGIFDLDLSTSALLWDDRVRAAFGVLSGRAVTNAEKLAAIHPDDRPEFDRRFAAALGGAEFRMDLRAVGIEDGVTRWVAVNGQVVRVGPEGGHFVGAVRDITCAVRLEEERAILHHELAHRLKNTLAVVQSIATQTLRTALDLPAAREALSRRIQTLSKAHDILLTGRHEAGAIEAIVRGAVGLHDAEGRIRLSGPDLGVGPKPALTLALVMHELATNAAKYGALSAPGGRVDIVWAVEQEGPARRPTLSLDWRETGGPPTRPPQRRGFGTRLIEMGLSPSGTGSVRLDYAECGLHCRFAAPLAELQALDEV